MCWQAALETANSAGLLGTLTLLLPHCQDPGPSCPVPSGTCPTTAPPAHCPHWSGSFLRNPSGQSVIPVLPHPLGLQPDPQPPFPCPATPPRATA